MCDTTRVHAAVRSKKVALQTGRLLPTRASSFLPVTSRISRVMARCTSTPSSHGDEIFRLPVELRTAMVDDGLVDLRLLRHYPRSTVPDLGIHEGAVQRASIGGGASDTVLQVTPWIVVTYLTVAYLLFLPLLLALLLAYFLYCLLVPSLLWTCDRHTRSFLEVSSTGPTPPVHTHTHFMRAHDVEVSHPQLHKSRSVVTFFPKVFRTC